MPYRNVVTSSILNRMLARRRLTAELPLPAKAPETESIWVPPDVTGRAKKDGPSDLPGHTWRAHSGVSNR